MLRRDAAGWLWPGMPGQSRATVRRLEKLFPSGPIQRERVSEQPDRSGKRTGRMAALDIAHRTRGEVTAPGKLLLAKSCRKPVSAEQRAKPVGRLCHARMALNLVSTAPP
jgi:hypothetical protein